MGSVTKVRTRIEARPAWRAVVVQVWGDVDHLTIETVRSAIDRGFAVSTPRPDAADPRTTPFDVLVLDLAQVTFFGSLGVVALLQAQEQAVGCGMRLVVAVPPGHRIRRITRMTAVDQDVDLAVSVDQALAVPTVGRHHKRDPG